LKYSFALKPVAKGLRRQLGLEKKLLWMVISLQLQPL
jgi:hypothetical protein